MQIAGFFSSRTEVVSSSASAANTRGAQMRLVPPASDRAVRMRRRVYVIVPLPFTPSAPS